MRDGGSEWRLALAALGVDMDPLMVVRGVGELIDTLLRDLKPVPHRDLLPYQRFQFLYVRYLAFRQWHSPCQRKLHSAGSSRCGIALNVSSDSRSPRNRNPVSEQLRTRQFTSKPLGSGARSEIWTAAPMNPPEVKAATRRLLPAPL